MASTKRSYLEELEDTLQRKRLRPYKAADDVEEFYRAEVEEMPRHELAVIVRRLLLDPITKPAARKLVDDGSYLSSVIERVNRGASPICAGIVKDATVFFDDLEAEATQSGDKEMHSATPGFCGLCLRKVREAMESEHWEAVWATVLHLANLCLRSWSALEANNPTVRHCNNFGHFHRKAEVYLLTIGKAIEEAGSTEGWIFEESVLQELTKLGIWTRSLTGKGEPRDSPGRRTGYPKIIAQLESMQPPVQLEPADDRACPAVVWRKRARLAAETEKGVRHQHDLTTVHSQFHVYQKDPECERIHSEYEFLCKWPDRRS